MSPQEENAAILRSHSTIKPEFVPHSGMFISDLCATVARIQDAPAYLPGLCGRCFNNREIAVNLPNGDYQIVDCLECVL